MVILALPNLKIDIPLPQYLRHIKRRLQYCQLVNCNGLSAFSHRIFELGVPFPRRAIVQHGLKVMGIQRLEAIDLVEGRFQRNIFGENCLLPAQSDCFPKELPRQLKITPLNVQFCGVDPNLGKTKFGVED